MTKADKERVKKLPIIKAIKKMGMTLIELKDQLKGMKEEEQEHKAELRERRENLQQLQDDIAQIDDQLGSLIIIKQEHEATLASIKIQTTNVNREIDNQQIIILPTVDSIFPTWTTI